MGRIHGIGRSLGVGLLSLCALALGAGCGAKTGLLVPDASDQNEPDAALDAGVDAPPCYEVPVDGGPLDIAMEVQAQVGRADVLLLIDTTTSMQEEIDQIRARLRDRIVPAISEALPDSQLGVASFADFPVSPYGSAGRDTPFTLHLAMTSSVADAQGAVNSIRLSNGADQPESQIEALYQTATGAGLGAYVAPSEGCPSGGTGYPCFRRDALPVVLLFTDAPMHNGPSGHGYGGLLSPPAHTYAATLRELNRLGVRVIGFDSGGGTGRSDLEAVARATNAVDAAGAPLVYQIGTGGERLSTGVVDAVRTFASTAVFDIDAIAVDPDPADGIDVTALVREFTPLSADPPEGVREIDRVANVFRGVRAGTRVSYRVVLQNGVITPGPEPIVLRLEVIFRGDGRTRLASRILEIVIPAADGAGCRSPAP